MRIYRSDSLDTPIPTNVNLTELLHRSARSPPLPDSHLIAKDDIEKRSLTIGQLRDTAGRLAQGLTWQYRPRDQSRWAIILPNSIAYIEAFHAVLWLGGVGCPINHQLKSAEIGHAFAVTKPDFVIAYSNVVGKVVEAVAIAKQSQPAWADPQIITAIGQNQDTRYPSLHLDFLAAERLPIPHHEDTAARLASIHLSSGTTGNPKGVGLSHYNYVANCYMMWAHDPDHWSPLEQVVSFSPFVHIANTTIPLFLGPWTGMVHIIMAAFELEALAQLVQENKATAMQAFPVVALTIANTDLVERYDFSSMRHMVTGGLPLKEDVYRKFLSRGNWKTIQLYGMTEAAPYVAWQKIGDTVPLGKIGTLLPNLRASLRLENGADAPEGGPGELWLKGPNMTAGYVDNPEANQIAFDRDGWYNTGDVCTIDPNGYLQIVGRTKELIKSSGFQVSPTELETYLNSHPDVADCAVGARWDDQKLTEVPAAYVVLKSHITDDQDKLRSLKHIQHVVDSQVSGYKKLRGGVWEVTQLPRNANMKFLRKKLATHKTGLCSLTSDRRSSKL